MKRRNKLKWPRFGDVTGLMIMWQKHLTNIQRSGGE